MFRVFELSMILSWYHPFGIFWQINSTRHLCFCRIAQHYHRTFSMWLGQIIANPFPARRVGFAKQSCSKMKNRHDKHMVASLSTPSWRTGHVPNESGFEKLGTCWRVQRVYRSFCRTAMSKWGFHLRKTLKEILLNIQVLFWSLLWLTALGLASELEA